MSQEPQQESKIRLVIHPVPSDQELAAITAAVTSLMAVQSVAESDMAKPVSKWRETARKEALRG